MGGLVSHIINTGTDINNGFKGRMAGHIKNLFTINPNFAPVSY
jgi:hypothetical protein